MTDDDTLAMPETEDETAPEAKEETAPETEDETAAAAEPEEEEKFKFVEDPAFDIDYKGDCAYEVTVSIPAANEKQQALERFDELSREAELPGFRKGRAPRRLLEKKLGKYVNQEVQQKLVTAAFEKLVEDEKLRPIGELVVDGLDGDGEREEDAPLTFTLKFEVAPRADLGKYRGIEIERPVLKVVDKEVDEAIERIRSRYSLYETVEEGTAQEGDQVIIDFHGTVEGEEFPGNQADNYPYILGTRRFFAEFDDALTGSKTGDELSCDVAFPDSYHNEELRGKVAAFSIKVNEIKRQTVPELNDEFAQQVGYDSVADLREKVAAGLREHAMAQSNAIASSRVVDALIEQSTFEFPKSLTKDMTEEAYEEEVQRLQQMRVPQAQIREREAELRQKAQTETMQALKSIVALNEIAEAEGVEVTEEDFEKEAADIGKRLGMAADEVAKLITQDDRRTTYELHILRAKATAVLLEHAAITDKEVPLDELEEELAVREGSEESSE